MEFDDGFSVPLHYLTPGMEHRVVPISTNCTVPSLPSAGEYYRLGEVLKEIVTKRWFGPERVAVIGTGGLSHEPGGPRYLAVDEDFDRWFLELLASGDITRSSPFERFEAARSGGTAELLT